MPKLLKPVTSLSTAQASRKQQEQVELLNTQINIKRDTAIEQARKHSDGEWIDLSNLPEKYSYLKELKNFKNIKPAKMQLRPGRDMEKALRFFIENAGVAHLGGVNYADRARSSRKKRLEAAEEPEFEMMEDEA